MMFGALDAPKSRPRRPRGRWRSGTRRRFVPLRRGRLEPKGAAGRAPGALDDEVGAVGARPDRNRVAAGVEGDLGFEGVLSCRGAIDWRREGAAGRARGALDVFVGAVGTHPNRDRFAGGVEGDLGFGGGLSAAERSTGAEKAPPAGEALWMMTLVPLERSQIATASPPASRAIWGSEAVCPAAERSTGAEKAPPAGREAFWMMKLVPLERVQTATASPAASMAICRLKAFCPAWERSTWTEKAPPAGREALWMMLLVPLGRTQPRPRRRRRRWRSGVRRRFVLPRRGQLAKARSGRRQPERR